jgi:hypothetical protein
MDSGHVELEILNCCYKSTVQFYAALLLKAWNKILKCIYHRIGATNR